MDTFFKSLPRYESCIISNGKSYIFDRSGTCIKEDAGLLPAYINGAIRVNIISAVSVNGRTEIALDTANGNFIKYETPKDASQVMSILLMRRGFSHFLKRNGVVDSIRYTQMLFVYPFDYNMHDVLSLLDVKEFGK